MRLLCSHAVWLRHDACCVNGNSSAAQRKADLITICCTAGGSAGIGKATALAFDRNGCKVAVLGRRKERLDAVVSTFKVLNYSHVEQ